MFYGRFQADLILWKLLRWDTVQQVASNLQSGKNRRLNVMSSPERAAKKGELGSRFLIVLVSCHVVQKDVIKERKTDS